MKIMGLDSGIVFNNDVGIDAPFWVKIADCNYDETEVCYWRKCWGIRNAIVNLFDGEDQYAYTLDRDAVIQIRKILKQFSNKKYWENYSHSIWSYEDMKRTLRRQRVALHWLARCMKKYPDLYVYFYDSY